jgi:hypothetical protein
VSSKVDIELARWLVTTERLPKEKAEGLLKAYRAELKSSEKGTKKKNWLSWLVEKGEFDLSQAKEIQKAFKDRNVRDEEPPVQESEAAVPETSFDDDGGEEGPTFEPDEGSDGESEGTEEDSVEDAAEEDDDDEEAPQSSTQKKKCEECLGENASDDKECSFCGAQLKAATFIDCAFCGYKEPVKSKSCGNCGSNPVSGRPTAKTQKCKTCKEPLKPTQAVCLSCGTPVIKSSATWWGFAGRAITLLQFILVFGALCGFRLMMREDGPTQNAAKEVEIIDPWAGLPPRGLSPGLDTWELNDESRVILERGLSLLKEGRFVEAEAYLEEEEDGIGMPGLVLLGLSYFNQNKGAELISLSKALPSNRSLKTMTALWRTWQARLSFRDFERAKAHRIIEQVLKGASVTPEQWFWGGVMALGEAGSWNTDASVATKKAKERFNNALLGEAPIREAHLFLFLINSKNKTGTEHLQKWIDASDDTKAAEALLEDYR